MNRKKQLKQAYKETPKVMGVYRIFNMIDQVSLIDSALDVPAKLNRHQAELKLGTHKNKALLADWKRLGSDAFVFELVEQLKPLEAPDYDPTDDLETLLAMTLEQASFNVNNDY